MASHRVAVKGTASNLPLVAYVAQPNIRERRASRIGEEQGQGKTENAVGSPARRSSVVLAHAVTTGAMPLETIQHAIFGSLSRGAWAEASDLISALGRIAQSGNRSVESKGNASRHTASGPAPAQNLSVAENMGEAGALAVVLRAMALGYRDRELCIRSLWCLENMLLPPSNRKRFVALGGIEAVQLAQEQYRWDDIILRASTDVIFLAYEWQAAEKRMCCVAPPEEKTPTPISHPERIDVTNPAAPISEAKDMRPSTCCCACGRSGGNPQYFDTLCASCASCSGLPLRCLSVLIILSMCINGDATYRRSKKKGDSKVTPTQNHDTSGAEK